MKNIYLFLFLQCCFSFNIYAQMGEIQGVVSDAETGEPIPFATVTIEVSGQLIGTATDFDGVYDLDSIPIGVYTVTFNAIAYKTMAIENVLVEENKLTKISPKLIIDCGVMEDIRGYQNYYPTLFNPYETRSGITISRTGNGHFYYSNIR